MVSERLGSGTSLQTVAAVTAGVPSTTIPTFFPAAVDGAVLYASSTRDAVVAVARYTGEQRRRWIKGTALIP